MKSMKIIGMDPSTSNWGICQAEVNLDTLDVVISDLILITTESEKAKGVMKQSDDLRRAKELRKGAWKACEGYKLCISEIPYMNPAGYPAANFNSGLVTGVLASLPIPLIQVFPQDVKMMATGARNAAKEEMIETAMMKHPEAPWLMRKSKGKMRPIKANEHLADAMWVIYTGLQSVQFQQLLAMYRSSLAA